MTFYLTKITIQLIEFYSHYGWLASGQFCPLIDCRCQWAMAQSVPNEQCTLSCDKQPVSQQLCNFAFTFAFLDALHRPMILIDDKATLKMDAFQTGSLIRFGSHFEHGDWQRNPTDIHVDSRAVLGDNLIFYVVVTNGLRDTLPQYISDTLVDSFLVNIDLTHGDYQEHPIFVNQTGILQRGNFLSMSYKVELSQQSVDPYSQVPTLMYPPAPDTDEPIMSNWLALVIMFSLLLIALVAITCCISMALVLCCKMRKQKRNRVMGSKNVNKRSVGTAAAVESADETNASTVAQDVKLRNISTKVERESAFNQHFDNQSAAQPSTSRPSAIQSTVHKEGRPKVLSTFEKEQRAPDTESADTASVNSADSTNVAGAYWLRPNAESGGRALF